MTIHTTCRIRPRGREAVPQGRPPGGGETGADAGLLAGEPEGPLALWPQAARPSTSPAQQAKALILRGLFIRRRLAGAAAAARPGPAQPPSSTSGLAIRA